MSMINRKTMLQKIKKPRVKKVMVPDWGKDAFCYVRQLRASELEVVDKLAAEASNGMPIGEAVAAWVILGVCDEKGKPVYEQSDRAELLNSPLKPLQDVAEAFMSFNGLGDDQGN